MSRWRASDLAEIGPDRYAAVFETKVAYMKFSFKVTVEMTRADPPNEIEAKVEGTPLGVAGRLTATSMTRLTDVGEGTQIAYEVEAALTGKLGSLGQPVLRSKAREMEKQFATRMSAAFQATPTGAASMTPFELLEPRSLREAIELLDPDDASVRPIAGGTALMLMMKAGVFQPARLVSLRGIEAMTAIWQGNDGGLKIGAMTPLAMVEQSAAVRGACTGHHADAAHAVERPRAQCRDCRRPSGARRPAHGSAAGADRARRAGDGRRPLRRAHDPGRRVVRRLFRDRAGARRTDLRADRAGAGRRAALAISNARRARCTTGRRSASRCRSTAKATACAHASIVISAATEKPTRLPRRGKGFARWPH